MMEAKEGKKKSINNQRNEERKGSLKEGIVEIGKETLKFKSLRKDTGKKEREEGMKEK